MAIVTFTQNLRRHINIDRCEVDAETVAGAMEQIFAQRPGARGYLLDDTGAVRRHVAMLLNGKSIVDRKTLSDTLPHNAELFILQALSGG